MFRVLRCVVGNCRDHNTGIYYQLIQYHETFFRETRTYYTVVVWEFHFTTNKIQHSRHYQRQ